MKYSPKQITMDLEEYNLLIGQLEAFRQRPEDGSLTKEETEEATGLLLVRAIQNPGLFKDTGMDIQLGKYRVMFAIIRGIYPQEDTIRIRFVRT